MRNGGMTRVFFQVANEYTTCKAQKFFLPQKFAYNYVGLSVNDMGCLDCANTKAFIIASHVTYIYLHVPGVHLSPFLLHYCKLNQQT